MAEAPGSRTQPPRVGGERPVLKTGRATGPRSLPCGTHHRMGLLFPRSTRVGRGALASRFQLGAGYEDRSDDTKPAFRAVTTRVSFGLGETRQR